MSNFRKKILLAVAGLFWMCIIGFIGLLVYLAVVFRNSREVVFAGYASGSIIDYRLELYEDNTYYISCFHNPDKERLTWKKRNDTLYLKIGERVCASFVNEKLIDFSCNEIRCIELMRFRQFSEPKIVEYPKNNY